MDQSVKKAVFQDSPGFFGVLSLDSKLLAVNKTGLNWIGFNSSEAVVGLTYDNLRCRAAEDAELFIWQDELVKKNQKPIYFLGCYCYANDSWKTIFGKKYLIKNEQAESIGIVSQFDDITNYQLIDVSRFIINSSSKFINKKTNQQFCFLLTDNSYEAKLSNRELECLFFLLRGKSNKSIAKTLNLSPRTVESYLEQIKFKMECSNKEELIEKGIYEGYINILPISLLEKNILG